MGWAGKYRYGVQHHGTYYAVKPTAGRRVHRRAHPSTSTKTYQQYHPLHTSVVHVTVDRYLHAREWGMNAQPWFGGGASVVQCSPHFSPLI